MYGGGRAYSRRGGVSERQGRCAGRPDGPSLALRAFLSEYRVTFPVGVDRHDGDRLPVTMRAYELQGTPSTLLIDREGRLRLSVFGALDDLALGAHLGQLLSESWDDPAT